MVKVSIIVPVYNVENYLDKCLNSLVNQTLKDIEIIVVNDGSTDNSQSIIDSYQNKYPKLIKVITQTNQGISIARNKGLEQAKGQYIAFVDSDDYVATNMLKKAYDYIEKKQSDIVVWNYYEVNTSGKILKKQIIPNFKTLSLKDDPTLLFSINPAPWNKLYKKTLFDNVRFPNDRTKYEDLMTITKVLINANKISKLEESFNYYLIRNNGETGSIDERVFDILKVLDHVNNYTKDKLIFNQFYDEITFLNIKHIMYQVLKQRYSKDLTMSKKFINEAYNFLNNNFPTWRKNPYYISKESIKNRLIKNNKIIIKIYCRIYKMIQGGKTK